MSNSAIISFINEMEEVFSDIHNMNSLDEISNLLKLHGLNCTIKDNAVFFSVNERDFYIDTTDRNLQNVTVSITHTIKNLNKYYLFLCDLDHFIEDPDSNIIDYKMAVSIVNANNSFGFFTSTKDDKELILSLKYNFIPTRNDFFANVTNFIVRVAEVYEKLDYLVDKGYEKLDDLADEDKHFVINELK